MNQEQIGKFIAELRHEKNLTQEQIAEKLNVNVKSVSRWENGRNLPDPSLMQELCDILGISINELFAGKRIKKNKSVRKIFIFYTLVSFTGVFVLPTMGIIAPTFILSSIIVPIMSLIKMIAFLFGIDIPIIMFQIGKYTLNPILGFILSLPISLFLYLTGIGAWRLLIKYIHYVSNKKRKLYIEL